MPTTVTRNRRFRVVTTSVILAYALSSGTVVVAAPMEIVSREVPGMTNETLPSELADKAFDRFVDLRQLAQAISEGNAELAVDIALQLAEGERVLSRSHKALTARMAVDLAVKIAAEKRDKKTLGRLAEYAKRIADQGLGQRISQAQALAGVARAIDPVFQVSAADTTVEEFTFIQLIARELEYARLTGKETHLAELIAEVKQAGTELVPPSRKAALLKRLETTQTEWKSTAAEPTALPEVLANLKGVSRTLTAHPSNLTPYVVLFDKEKGNGKRCGETEVRGNKDINFTFSTGEAKKFKNDEAQSLVLSNVLPGTKITLFDSSRGRGQGDYDDRLEITVHKLTPAIGYKVNSVEASYVDQYVRVTYFRVNGLKGKVSRMEIRAPN